MLEAPTNSPAVSSMVTPMARMASAARSFTLERLAASRTAARAVSSMSVPVHAALLALSHAATISGSWAGIASPLS